MESNAQNSVFINNGVLEVSDKTVVSFYSNFQNDRIGQVSNNGFVYYYGDFKNNGSYDFNRNQKAGKVFFIGNRFSNKKIQGNALTSLYDIVFDNDHTETTFDLKGHLDIWGGVDFKQGIVYVDSTYNPETKLTWGMISFMKDASYINLSRQSYVDGQVEKIGNKAFDFPIGNKNKVKPARITAPKDVEDVIVGKYVVDDKKFFVEHAKTVSIVEKLNTKEYWYLEGQHQSNQTILLTLSWDDEFEVNVDAASDTALHIVRWDDTQKLWVDEGGVVNQSAKEVTTTAEVKRYGYFTLAKVKKKRMLADDVVIYNLVTPNGDGKNDYFIIDKINRYPNNTVEIYNRWGYEFMKLKDMTLMVMVVSMYLAAMLRVKELRIKEVNYLVEPTTISSNMNIPMRMEAR